MATILIVEDDVALSEIYKIRLEAEGYRVVTAQDGEEGLATVVTEKPDLILSDVMMPRVSGFDMLDILKRTPNTRNIKVIMMTALGGDDHRERGESLGANAYLVKSQVGIEDVVAAVKKVLAEPNVAQQVAPANEAPTVAPAPQRVVPVAPVANPAPTTPAPATPATTPVSPAPATPPAAPTVVPPTPPVTSPTPMPAPIPTPEVAPNEPTNPPTAQ